MRHRAAPQRASVPLTRASTACRTKDVTGSTNNSNDVVIRDISEIMRPNLRMASRCGAAPGGGASAPLTAADPRSPKKKREDGAHEGKGLDVDTQLRQVFQYYCLFGRTAGSKDEVDSIGAPATPSPSTRPARAPGARPTRAPPPQTTPTLPNLRASALASSTARSPAPRWT